MTISMYVLYQKKNSVLFIMLMMMILNLKEHANVVLYLGIGMQLKNINR